MNEKLDLEAELSLKDLRIQELEFQIEQMMLNSKGGLKKKKTKTASQTSISSNNGTNNEIDNGSRSITGLGSFPSPNIQDPKNKKSK